MARDLGREARLPEPYRSAVQDFAAIVPYARHQNLYTTAEALVAHGGALPDEPGYTAETFFADLRGRITEARVQRSRLMAAERAEGKVAQRLAIARLLSGGIATARKYPDTSFWLFHGTSSKLLPSIRKHGLRGDLRRTDVVGSKTRSVYLTSIDTDEPCGALRYADAAVRAHGGAPALLRVIALGRDLEPDPDDADIACGRSQFVTDFVPPEHLYTYDGQHLLPARWRR